MSKGCQGGFCALRDKCPMYRPGMGFKDPDRLCLPGSDGVRLVKSTPSRQIVSDMFKRRKDQSEMAA